MPSSSGCLRRSDRLRQVRPQEGLSLASFRGLLSLIFLQTDISPQNKV